MPSVSAGVERAADLRSVKLTSTTSTSIAAIAPCSSIAKATRRPRSRSRRGLRERSTSTSLNESRVRSSGTTTGVSELDRHASARIVRRSAKRAGIEKRISPHSLRHSFITAALDAGVRSGTCKKPRRTQTRERRCVMTAVEDRSTATPPTSSPPSSPAPAADHTEWPSADTRLRRRPARILPALGSLWVPWPTRFPSTALGAEPEWSLYVGLRVGRSRFGRCHSSRQVGPLGAEHVRNGVQHVDGSDEVPVDVQRTAGGRTLLDGEIRLVRGSSS